MTVLSKVKRVTAAILSILIVAVFAVAFVPRTAQAVWGYGSVYRNPDTGYEVYIYDYAMLLSDDELESLIQDMVPITEYAAVLFYTEDINVYGSADNLSDAVSYDIFGSTPGIAFIIDMDNRQLRIWGQNGAEKSFQRGIGKNYADVITDNVYRYATNGYYYTCASKTFEQIYSAFAGERIASPMKVISNALIALVAGFLIAFGAVASKTAPPKPVIKNAAAIVVGTVAVAGLTSALINTKRVYSPRSSSSGGHGGGGRGGGGHHGGGGGHGF